LALGGDGEGGGGVGGVVYAGGGVVGGVGGGGQGLGVGAGLVLALGDGGAHGGGGWVEGCWCGRAGANEVGRMEEGDMVEVGVLGLLMYGAGHGVIVGGWDGRRE